jgi:hypothetical protein
MADRAKLVVQAHELRTTVAQAALLHGSRRSGRESRRQLTPLLVSVLVAALLVAVVVVAARFGVGGAPHPATPAHAATQVAHQQLPARPGETPA